jgi:hypothetical protein
MQFKSWNVNQPHLYSHVSGWHSTQSTSPWDEDYFTLQSLGDRVSHVVAGIGLNLFFHIHE